MSQSKRASFTETCFNMLIGIIIADFVWLLIIIPWSRMWGWGFIEVDIGRVTAVNVTFTIISFVRVYCTRRFFNYLGIKKILR